MVQNVPHGVGAYHLYFLLTEVGAKCTYLVMTHADLINQWPSLAVFAADLGVPYVTAKAMRRRMSIPASYWSRLVECAAARQLDGVTLEALASAIAMDPEAAE